MVSARVGVRGKKGEGGTGGDGGDGGKGAYFMGSLFLAPHRFFTLLGYAQTPTRTMYVEYVGFISISHLLVPRAHVARNTSCLHLHTTCMAMEDLQRTGGYFGWLPFSLLARTHSARAFTMA